MMQGEYQSRGSPPRSPAALAMICSASSTPMLGEGMEGLWVCEMVLSTKSVVIVEMVGSIVISTTFVGIEILSYDNVVDSTRFVAGVVVASIVNGELSLIDSKLIASIVVLVGSIRAN